MGYLWRKYQRPSLDSVIIKVAHLIGGEFRSPSIAVFFLHFLRYWVLNCGIIILRTGHYSFQENDMPKEATLQGGFFICTRKKMRLFCVRNACENRVKIKLKHRKALIYKTSNTSKIRLRFV